VAGLRLLGGHKKGAYRNLVASFSRSRGNAKGKRMTPNQRGGKTGKKKRDCGEKDLKPIGEPDTWHWLGWGLSSFMVDGVLKK